MTFEHKIITEMVYLFLVVTTDLAYIWGSLMEKGMGSDQILTAIDFLSMRWY